MEQKSTGTAVPFRTFQRNGRLAQSGEKTRPNNNPLPFASKKEGKKVKSSWIEIEEIAGKKRKMKPYRSASPIAIFSVFFDFSRRLLLCLLRLFRVVLCCHISTGVVFFFFFDFEVRLQLQPATSTQAGVFFFSPASTSSFVAALVAGLLWHLLLLQRLRHRLRSPSFWFHFSRSILYISPCL